MTYNSTLTIAAVTGILAFRLILWVFRLLWRTLKAVFILVIWVTDIILSTMLYLTRIIL